MKRHTVLRRVMLGLLILVLVTVTAGMVHRMRAKHAMERYFAELRAKGIPVTPADLAAKYPVPAGPNAADVYRKAFKAYKPIMWPPRFVARSADLKPPYHPERLTPDEQEVVAKWLDVNKEAFALLHKAADMKNCRFVDFAKGQDNPFADWWKPMQDCVMLLATKTLWEANEGTGEEAWEAAGDVMALVHSTARDPDGSMQIFRLAFHRTAADSVRELFSKKQVDELAAKRLTEELDNVPIVDPWVAAIEANRCLTVEHMRGVSGNFPVWWWAMYEGVGLRFLDILEFSRSQVYLAESTRQGLLRPSGAPLPSPPGPITAPSTFLMPLTAANWRGFGGTRSASLLIVMADVAALKAALEIANYASSHGTFPESLDALGTLQSWTDPFTGQPLVYRIDEDSAAVYSLGINQQDDGGPGEGMLPLFGGGPDDVGYIIPLDLYTKAQ